MWAPKDERSLVLWAAFGEGKESNIWMISISFAWFYFAGKFMPFFSVL